MWNTFNDRLGQSIFHPQYFAKRGEYACIAQVKKLAKKYNGRAVFLDVGCGRQWYRAELAALFKKYIALDHPQEKKRYETKFPLEIEADAAAIPLPAASVDIVMMNLVIEHLPDVPKVIKEVKRILKNDGKLVLFAVENYPAHDTLKTYFHSTEDGLRGIFTRANIRVEEVVAFGNYWETSATFLAVYLMRGIKKQMSRKKTVVFGLVRLCLVLPLIVVANMGAFLLGRGRSGSEFAIGHLISGTSQ